ncbi:hypothetical protein HYU09_00385 [Candidatus Woesearchaeota archaeon]|nr:hypothetical protein [Candidatus Woesearchaeota archaeon]
MKEKDADYNRPSIPDIKYWGFDKDGKIIIKKTAEKNSGANGQAKKTFRRDRL